jgi:hypothetical protein
MVRFGDTSSNDDTRAKADVANNGDRSGVDGDGSRGGATQVRNATIARVDKWAAGCH